MSGSDYFDQAAAQWDSLERRVQLAHSVAETITTRVHLTHEMAVLDLGCGTGLVTLELAPLVGSMTGADTSSGMLKVMAEKAEAKGLSVRPIVLDPVNPTDLGGPYDLIISSMTLHHIQDVPALLRELARQLRPGGQVALADLDEEDGSFHDDHHGIAHRGFSRAALRTWLEASGFCDVRLSTAAVTRKNQKDYSVFLVTAQIA